MTIKLICALHVAMALGVLFSSAASQTINSSRRQYVVNPKQPSVHIRQVAAAPSSLAEPNKDARVFFRFYNNLKWPLRLTVSTAGRNEGDVQLDYDLLKADDAVSGGYECHICTMIRLNSGKSLLFSLPASEVATSSRIRVEYSYWWEDSRDVGTEKEPFHYVLFTFEGK